ncbi:MAG: 50S ribosomal protein L13 [Halobacteria archaeon]
MRANVDIEPDVVIDGEGAILGRLASKVASATLDGDSVVIVNSDKIVVSGETDDVVERYRQKANEHGSDKGPYHPRRPDGIAKRSVRGMVPYKKQRGKDALSRLRFYVDVPDDVDESEIEEFREDASKLGIGGYVTLGEVSERIGGNVTW